MLVDKAYFILRKLFPKQKDIVCEGPASALYYLITSRNVTEKEAREVIGVMIDKNLFEYLVTLARRFGVPAIKGA